MLVDFSYVAHDALPVGSLDLAHFVDVLQSYIKVVQTAVTIEINGELTKVVLMPTRSAAENARLKFRFLSSGVSSSYGIISGRYECIRAQSAIPSFQLELRQEDVNSSIQR